MELDDCIRVSNREQEVFIDLEEDETVLLETVKAQFGEGVIGLRYEFGGGFRAVRMRNGVLHPPKAGWGDRTYVVVANEEIRPLSTCTTTELGSPGCAFTPNSAVAVTPSASAAVIKSEQTPETSSSSPNDSKYEQNSESLTCVCVHLHEHVFVMKFLRKWLITREGPSHCWDGGSMARNAL